MKVRILRQNFHDLFVLAPRWHGNCNMTSTESKFFAELTQRRKWLADAFDDPAATGIHDSVVEKYSDQAHFIYELSQNADDVGATSAIFKLFSDKLIFVHNGTHHFTITNPSREREDKASGILGDMNAITSVGNSNKQEASIGKFGVGFKSVFQYTETPYIYDNNFRFRMERFIVPIEIDLDFPGRKSEETVFVFPFNHPQRSAVEAFEDIADKLQNLVFPILFLKTLKDIFYEIETGSVKKYSVGHYGKHALDTRQFGKIVAQKLKLDQSGGNAVVNNELWMFSSKTDNGFNISVGYFLTDENKLAPVRMPAFCFFPTKEVTNLEFVIHAPFLLTDSREGIKAGVTHNRKLIEQLAKLAADGLHCLQQIGNEKSIRYIDDSILNIVPINEDDFASLTDKSRISFLPFYYEMQKALCTLIRELDSYLHRINRSLDVDKVETLITLRSVIFPNKKEFQNTQPSQSPAVWEMVRQYTKCIMKQVGDLAECLLVDSCANDSVINRVCMNIALFKDEILNIYDLPYDEYVAYSTSFNYVIYRDPNDDIYKVKVNQYYNPNHTSMDIGWCKRDNIWEQLRSELDGLSCVDNAKIQVKTTLDCSNLNLENYILTPVIVFDFDHGISKFKVRYPHQYIYSAYTLFPEIALQLEKYFQIIAAYVCGITNKLNITEIDIKNDRRLQTLFGTSVCEITRKNREFDSTGLIKLAQDAGKPVLLMA